MVADGLGSSAVAVDAPRYFVYRVVVAPNLPDPDGYGRALLANAHQLGFDGLTAIHSERLFFLQGPLAFDDALRLSHLLLVDPVTELLHVKPWTAESSDERAAAAASQIVVETTYLPGVTDPPGDNLVRAARMLGTSGLQNLAQTWSEHCVHKTFKAEISYSGPLPGGSVSDVVEQEIDGLLDTYIRKATEEIACPWVRSAFVDNAGIIAFDKHFDLAFKVETHNHPSALEPFGGANTGIGGVVRNVLGVSARPIANTDVLCFGPADTPLDALPTGVLHPRRIADGVVAGIEDYGNKMGIPTVNGSIHYHEGYTANPLVYCGCLGILPRDSHPTDLQPGDLIVAVGGRTGRDGLRGATFSSMEMDVSTSEIAESAVQIGNPIQEKQIQEVVVRARDEGLYNAITDRGAGGFSSAVGEMGEKIGARIQLQQAPLKYPGRRPWEIWLSEAQERMVLAVPRHDWPRMQAIAREQDVEATCLGEFEESGRLRIFYGDKLVGDLSMTFLHDGVPRRRCKHSGGPC